MKIGSVLLKEWEAWSLTPFFGTELGVWKQGVLGDSWISTTRREWQIQVNKIQKTEWGVR